MFLDYFALGIIFFVVITLFYGIIALHDIPYEISKKRNHPHQDAIHVAGWVSLFTLHVIWPFLWIWATLYREDRGWGFKDPNRRDLQGSSEAGMERWDHRENEVPRLYKEIESLNARLASLESLQKEKG